LSLSTCCPIDAVDQLRIHVKTPDVYLTFGWCEGSKENPHSMRGMKRSSTTAGGKR
jgi:hypothetical protein